MTNLALDLVLDSDTSEEDKSEDEDEDENDWIDDIEEKALVLAAVQHKRYLKPRARIEKAPPICEFLLNRLEDKRFKQQFRMPRVYFLKLCNLVSSNSVFHNNSKHPQRPVEEQMMVALKRLGCFGNGASVGMLATFFGISEGTVEIYTNRCIVAIEGLHEQFLQWPNKEARQEIQEEFKSVGFDGCVGVIDGTLMILQTCPEKDGQDYYNRKGSYGIATLLVCDKDKKIQYVYTGWPGCSHDQRLMTNSLLVHDTKERFSNGQYLLADSAFTATVNTVPAFKRQKNRVLTDEEHNFNRNLSGMQVVIENCIGLLKNRFQSLKGLRIRVAGDKDMARVNAWIIVCLQAHCKLYLSFSMMCLWTDAEAFCFVGLCSNA